MDQDRIETASPWDGDAGAARTLDLDVATRTSSPLDSLLRSPAAQTTKPPIREGEPADDLTALMTGARELFDLGDFSGSLELVEKALRSNPDHEDARAYLKRNEATLLHMYQSKIGNMGTIPRQLVPPDEIIWLNMHHRAGFILSQVDGTLAYEDLLDVSGMDRFDTMRILADLVQNRIIG
jgi:tetratricopeptide (TPR) repeat protein